MILFRWCILCLICLCTPSTIFAQTQTISISQAVELSMQNSLQQELSRQEKLRKQGEAVQSGAFPNPRFSVYHEQLDRGTINYHETTYQVSQLLELLGQPVLRSRKSSLILEAAEYEYISASHLHAYRVKQLYLDYWQAKNILRSYSDALDTIESLMESAKARQEEGIFSGIETQRFAIEFNRYNQLRNELNIAALQIKQELVSLIFAGSVDHRDIRFEDSFTVEPLIIEKDAVARHAISIRPDIRALEQRQQAFDLQYTIERRNRFPDVNLDVGYKNQSDGAEGLVFGFSLNIPLFDQNSGNVTESRAAAKSAEVSLQIQQQAVRNQIHASVEKIEQLYQQWEQRARNPDTETLLETAKLAYDEGRLTLLELLDATKAWLDDRINHYKSITAYNQAVFELDALTSGMILSANNPPKQ